MRSTQQAGSATVDLVQMSMCRWQYYGEAATENNATVEEAPSGIWAIDFAILANTHVDRVI